jgi:hypothetical protein
MKITYSNKRYYLDGVPTHAGIAQAMLPVESQRARAAWFREQAAEILENPKAIVAARRNAERMAREAEVLALSAEIDEAVEVEWKAR